MCFICALLFRYILFSKRRSRRRRRRYNNPLRKAAAAAGLSSGRETFLAEKNTSDAPANRRVRTRRDYVSAAECVSHSTARGLAQSKSAASFAACFRPTRKLADERTSGRSASSRFDRKRGSETADRAPVEIGARSDRLCAPFVSIIRSLKY